MRYLFLIFNLCVVLQMQAQQVSIKKFSEVESFISAHHDSIYVINFWATWCKPCVEELPAFEKLNQNGDGKNVQVILISLDAENKWSETLPEFLHAKNIKSKVWVIEKERPQNWIDRINADWNGTIPGTLFLFKNNKLFLEKQFTYEELTNQIHLITQ